MRSKIYISEKIKKNHNVFVYKKKHFLKKRKKNQTVHNRQKISWEGNVYNENI